VSDPVGLILVGSGGWVLKKLVEPSLGVLAAHLKEQFEGFLGENRRSVLEATAVELQARNESPHSIPTRVLLQILERAGYEDEDFLRKRWAALLATAATSGEGEQVPPAFAQILAQLTPESAAVLEQLSKMEQLAGPSQERWGFTAEELTERMSEIRPAGMAPALAEVLMAFDIAHGTGLIEREPALLMRGDAMVPTDTRDVHLSVLGHRFVKACTPAVEATL
jgi:hypothetical protein